MSPACTPKETAGGPQNIFLPDGESESSDGSFITAPEQSGMSDSYYLSGFDPRTSTDLENEISIGAPTHSFLSVYGQNNIDRFATVAGNRATSYSLRGSDKIQGESDAANKHSTSKGLSHRQDRVNEGSGVDAAVGLLNAISAAARNDEYPDYSISNPTQPSSGLYQDTETVDEALSRAISGSTVNIRPNNVATWTDEDALDYYSANEWWGDDDSDGEASAVERSWDVEYSASDVDLSDEDLRDEDSIEVDYPTDEDESTGQESEEELLDYLSDSENSNAEKSDSEEEARPPSPLSQLSLPSITPSPPVIAQNQVLSEQLTTRNPWRTLEQYYPRQDDSTDEGPYFPICRLPIELLCMVAKRLPPESAASFALSSKRIYMALGTQYLKFEDKSSLWKFLLLIEPERQASFACCICLKLHRPSISQKVGVSKCTKLRARRLDARLPESITSGLVKMIGRKHLEDPRVCQEYLSWAAVSIKKTTRHIKVAQHVTPRMVDGNLLIKTETYVNPFHNGKLTNRSLHELLRLLETSWYVGDKLTDICAHLSWEDEMGITQKLEDYIEDSLPTGYKHRSRWMRTQHKQSSYSNVVSEDFKSGMLPPVMDSFLFHNQPSGVPSPHGGKVHSCNRCVTSYSITTCDVAGGGRCMVFTTWKDLGGVGPGQAAKWDTFFDVDTPLSVRRPGPRTVRRPPSAPWPFITYEDAEVQYSIFKTITDVSRYRPEPDRKMVRDLTRRTKKRQPFDGDGNYSTTASNADTDEDSEEDDISFFV